MFSLCGAVGALAAIALMSGCLADPHANCDPKASNCIRNTAGGASGAGGSSATLVGTLELFRDATFTARTPFANTALVEARVRNTELSLTWPGSGTFSFRDLELNKDTWLRVTPKDNRVDALPGLYVVHPTEATSTTAFPLARTSVIDDLFTTSVVPTLRSPERAQVLVFFWDTVKKRPASGIQIEFEQAEFVAYGSSSGWSAQEGARTGDLGASFAANVVVGGDADVGTKPSWETYRTVRAKGATAGTWLVHVEKGAATLIEIAVQPTASPEP